MRPCEIYVCMFLWHMISDYKGYLIVDLFFYIENEITFFKILEVIWNSYDFANF